MLLGAWTQLAPEEVLLVLRTMLPSPDFSTESRRGNEGNCYFICTHELGCNQLCHIGCHTVPLVKIKAIFQI